MLNNIVIQKTKEHFKKNKDKYVTGVICFVAGSVLTHALTKPSLKKLNVYNMYFNEQYDSDKIGVPKS